MCGRHSASRSACVRVRVDRVDNASERVWRGAAECARGELTKSMLVTESGIVTLVRLLHPLKALCESQRARARAAERGARTSERVWRGASECARGELTSPMLVIVSPMVMLVRLVHS